jgi:hypothetical protein
LGYNCDNATCSEEFPNEYHSYQIRESCCLITVKALEDESEEGSAPILKDALNQLEKAPNTVDELAEINLGTEEDPRPTFISASLPEEVTDRLKTFLKSYMDCFAWSYKEMSGLDPDVARVRTFQQGELVLVLKRPIIGWHIGLKFSPNWERPYTIEKVYGGGAYQLIDHEGERPMPPINRRYLKKYYT